MVVVLGDRHRHSTRKVVSRFVACLAFGNGISVDALVPDPAVWAGSSFFGFKYLVTAVAQKTASGWDRVPFRQSTHASRLSFPGGQNFLKTYE